MSLRLLRPLGLVFVVMACSEPANEDGSSDAVVVGVVSRASGAPVAFALLSALVVDSARDQTIINGDQAFRTDSTGHFSGQLGVFLYGPFTGRVQLTIRPGGQLGDTTVDAGFLQFGREPLDTSTTTVVYP